MKEWHDRPSRCEKCGCDRVASIFYGLPEFTKTLEDDLEAGRVVLGGCCVHPGIHEWRCLGCHHEWGDAYKSFEEVKRRARTRWWQFWKM